METPLGSTTPAERSRQEHLESARTAVDDAFEPAASHPGAQTNTPPGSENWSRDSDLIRKADIPPSTPPVVGLPKSPASNAPAQTIVDGVVTVPGAGQQPASEAGAPSGSQEWNRPADSGFFEAPKASPPVTVGRGPLHQGPGGPSNPTQNH